MDDNSLQEVKSSNLNKKPFLLGNFTLKKKAFILIFIIIVCGIIVVLTFNKSTQPVTTDKVKDKTNITQINEVADVVSRYSEEISGNNKEINITPLNKWDKATLDKAYINLVYADKIGAYSQVFDTLYLIDMASKSNINIDDNSYGINQSMRDQIRVRAEQKVKIPVVKSEDKI